MNEEVGWIKLSRKILQSAYYYGERFARPMCWIDLLLTAQWQKSRSFYIRGIQVNVKRGQLAVTLSDLSKRWNLSVNTVRSRLKEMVSDGRIELETNNLITRITILNWERYQCESKSSCLQQEKTEGNEAQISSSKTNQDATPTIPLDNDERTSQQPLEPIVGILPEPAKTKKQEVDCDFILRFYHDRCPSLPKVLKLSDKRRMKIRVRFEEMSFNYDTLQQVFDKAEASNFLRGDNARGWRADFDWIFSNSTNWLKILEGKYDNKPIKETRYDTQPQDRFAKRRGADSEARSAEDYTDTL